MNKLIITLVDKMVQTIRPMLIMESLIVANLISLIVWCVFQPFNWLVLMSSFVVHGSIVFMLVVEYLYTVAEMVDEEDQLD